MPWKKYLHTSITILLFLLVILFVGLRLKESNLIMRDPLPPLAFQDTKEFNALLKETFPLGIPETDIITTLAKNKFEAGWSTIYTDHATLSIAYFPCLKEWHVYWNTDAEGKLKEIKGQYETTCL